MGWEKKRGTDRLAQTRSASGRILRFSPPSSLPSRQLPLAFLGHLPPHQSATIGFSFALGQFSPTPRHRNGQVCFYLYPLVLMNEYPPMGTPMPFSSCVAGVAGSTPLATYQPGIRTERTAQVLTAPSLMASPPNISPGLPGNHPHCSRATAAHPLSRSNFGFPSPVTAPSPPTARSATCMLSAVRRSPSTSVSISAGSIRCAASIRARSAPTKSPRWENGTSPAVTRRLISTLTRLTHLFLVLLFLFCRNLKMYFLRMFQVDYHLREELSIKLILSLVHPF